MVTEHGQSEDLARIGPRDGCRHPHGAVADQETTEDKGITEEENPHHGFSPVRLLESALIGGPVSDYTRCAVQQWCRFGCGGLRSLRHMFLFPLSNQQQTEHDQPHEQQEVPVHGTQFHAHADSGNLSTLP